MAAQAQKPSQEKEEKRKGIVTTFLYSQSLSQNEDKAKERNLHQKRLLFKANDYLCK